MRYGMLGGSGLTVSRVGLGCNNFGGHDRPTASPAPVARLDVAATRAVVDAALDAGVTFLDTADFYGNRGGSEEVLAEVLQDRRERVVLATKFGEDMGDGELARGRAAYIRRAVEASLRRLQTDWIDLCYYHRPDGVTSLEETLGGLAELVREGKVREIGVSNMTLEQLEECARLTVCGKLVPVRALQNVCNLLDRRALRAEVPRCLELGIGFIPFFPLASGMLTGKYSRGEPIPAGTRLARAGNPLLDSQFDAVEALELFARDRGHSLLELAIAALASTPGISSVIAGATTPQQVRANAAAADWELAPGELRDLHVLLDGLERSPEVPTVGVANSRRQSEEER
jgi:aryl-alcohol dehydrogenase-like predicted oxidoreductase